MDGFCLSWSGKLLFKLHAIPDNKDLSQDYHAPRETECPQTPWRYTVTVYTRV